ncbi:type II secretion system protein GspF [Azospira sp. I13]|uniref:type II secretion system F family protein n=1 Tax=Azospira sp. I13 TaxID=1765050 RepID=UPI000D45FA46|nr:type II secretion system F family protein [Azospira sp. I13]GBG02258.1 type II secretion system protein GspF [Azospira sp. I13]
MEFEYTALGRDGFEIKGNEQADSREALEQALRQRQLTLIKAKALKARGSSLKLTTTLLSEVAPLLSRGLPLERALKILGEDTPDKDIAALSEQLRGGIKKGQALSQVMQQSGRFDHLVIALIKVGEASGSLAQVMEILARYYSEQSQFRRELVSTLAYPAILAFVSISSIIGLIAYVVPVFQDMLADVPAAKLPMGTRIVFALSTFLHQYGLIALVIGVSATVGIVQLVKRREELRRRWLAWLMVAPFVGQLSGELEGFKIAKSLGIMLQSGVQLSRAMELCRSLFRNELRRDGLESCIAALRKGRPVPEAFQQIPGLPVQLHRFVNLGNETGALGESLEKASEMLYIKSRSRLKSLVSMLDPIIILVMGSLIGFMVISILLAVFNLSDVK